MVISRQPSRMCRRAFRSRAAGQRGETLGPDGERRSTVTGWCAELWVMTPAQPRQLGLVLPSFSGLNPVITDWPPEPIKSGGSLIAGTALAGYTFPRPA